MTPEAFADRYLRPAPGPALVVGSKVYEGRTDRRERYADAVGADMESGAGVDVVIDLEEPLPQEFGPFAHVDCISVLEHSRRPWLLAENIERLLRPQGTLYVQVPFVWRLHGYPSDYWRFTVEGVRQLFGGIEWKVLQFVNGIAKGVPNMRHEDHLYFAKNEVCGFGWKR